MTRLPYESLREKLNGQRIMLVGGAGFIGHNLAIELAGLRAEVMVVDNLMINSLIENSFSRERDPVQRQAYQNFLLSRFELMRETGVTMRNADARIVTDLARCFEEFQPTKVVHLAAIASAVDAAKDPGITFDLQLVTLRNTLELSRLHQDSVNQMMFMSSSTVYGDFREPEVDESSDLHPEGIYANAKFMGERLVRTYRKQFGVGTTVVRPSALYGERCISRRVSQKFIENALTGKPLLLEGGGDGRLDFTYIPDLVQGQVRALALHATPDDSNTFNITFGNARTIRELADIIKDIVPQVNLEERPRAVEKPIRGTLSTRRAHSVLGFEPKWHLKDGYKRYCEWYAGEWERAQYRSNAA